jgi:hypothetical protein
LQGFAANQGDGLRFNLPDVSGRHIGIYEPTLFSVSELDMAQFMEGRLVRELTQGIDGDAALERVSLSVPVRGREINLLDTQLSECSGEIESRY